MRFLIRFAAILLLFSGMSELYAEKANKKEQKLSASRQLATIDGVAITEGQVRLENAESFESLELQNLRAKAIAARNEHQMLEESLERLIEETLLRDESKKQGISREELLAREVQSKISEPTAEEVEAFYSENKQRITKSKEEALPQIQKYLKQQREEEVRDAFFSRLEREYKVVRMLEPLRFDVSAGDGPAIGPGSAPVRLIEFSDFQCPYCKRFGATMKEVVKQYGDKVQLVFRQFPLTNIHANAQRAAGAALCAQAQGRFWEMHDLLFENQSKLLDEDLKGRAEKLGLNAPAFNSCLDSKRYEAKIAEDVRAASAAGVEGTPALFINGRFLYGSRSLEEISGIIDEELARGAQQKRGKK